MAKVYCGECRFWLGSTNQQCQTEYVITHTAVRPHKTYIDCVKKNKNNDCSDFKVKLSRWRKRPMWNQDWGRCKLPNCPCPPPPPKRKSNDEDRPGRPL